MAVRARVLAPLLNVNEPTSQIAIVAVADGDRVREGDVICELETTKAAAEVLSPVEGFVRALRVEVGSTVAAEELLCVITERADEDLPVDLQLAEPPSADRYQIPEGIRLTNPARELAEKHAVDLSSLNRAGRVLTVVDVRQLVESRDLLAQPSPETTFDNRLVLFGGGGHGRILLDILAGLPGYRVAGIVDDGLPRGKLVQNVAVIGGRDDLASLAASGIRLAANAIGGVPDLRPRLAVGELLRGAGFSIPALVHTRATVERSAFIADGIQVMAMAYVGSSARLERGAIVNSGAVVSHDCVIGAYSHVAPGAILAGDVLVGQRCIIGMGAAISFQVRIGDNARVGNGAVVNADVAAGGIVPAGTVWPRKK